MEDIISLITNNWHIVLGTSGIISGLIFGIIRIIQTKICKDGASNITRDLIENNVYDFTVKVSPKETSVTLNVEGKKVSKIEIENLRQAHAQASISHQQSG